MRFGRIGAKLVVLGLAIAVGAPSAADARPGRSGIETVRSKGHVTKAGMGGRHLGGRSYYSRGGISCVPFARENSGIELSGNAWQWWNNAEGVYQRGARPEVGSVMNFRANGRMRMGHVAVVTNVVDSRNVEIDHANWSGPGASRGGVSRDITVVDVSERNDWTAVRVGLGHTGDFGSVYPTYGFIYDRPDRGTMVANANAGTAPAPVLNAPPRDLRPASERMGLAPADAEEVAEAEDAPRVRHAAHRVRGAKPTVTKASAPHGAGRAAVTKVKAGSKPVAARKRGQHLT